MKMRWTRRAALVVVSLLMAATIPQVSSASTTTAFKGLLGIRHLMQYSDNGTEEEVINNHQLDDNTVRVDPLNHLKKYRGGYDIRNKNYWSSIVFTGIYGYSIAVLWLLCGIFYGVYLLVVNSFVTRNPNHKNSDNACRIMQYRYLLWLRMLTMFLILLSIIGTGLVLGEDAKFHYRAKKVVGIIIDTADNAVHTLKNTAAAMASDNGTSTSAISSNFLLASSYQSLDSVGDNIQRQARKNRRAINNGLHILYTITTIIISLHLVTVIALSAFGALRLRKLFHMSIVLCWILTALVCLFFGIYSFLSNFAGDTCTALEGFQKNPYNNSLSSLLPCDEIRSAKSVLRDASIEIHQLVNEINRNISLSYGNVAQICNPFSPPPQYLYQPDNCPSTSVKIGDVPKLLKTVGCPDYGGGTCVGGLLIPARDYYKAVTYATSTQRLLDVYPALNSLVECQTVTDAFTEILNHQCKPLKKDARMLCVSTMLLFVGTVTLLLTCTVAAHHQQHTSDSPVSPEFSTDINVVSPQSGGATAAKKLTNVDILPSSVL